MWSAILSLLKVLTPLLAAISALFKGVAHAIKQSQKKKDEASRIVIYNDAVDKLFATSTKYTPVSSSSKRTAADLAGSTTCLSGEYT